MRVGQFLVSYVFMTFGKSRTPIDTVRGVWGIYSISVYNAFAGLDLGISRL